MGTRGVTKVQLRVLTNYNLPQVNIFDPRPASPIPCLDTFHGGQAFSEPETRAVRDFVMSKRHRLQAYLAFHSFGNKILYPWGYTNKPTDDEEDLKGLAEVAKTAISTSFAENRNFIDGQFSEDLISRYDVTQISHGEENEAERRPSQSSNSLSRIIFGDPAQVRLTSDWSILIT